MIRDLPVMERPREKCLKYGVNTLSLRELFALLYGSGPRGLGAMGLASKTLESLCGKEWSENSFFSILQSLHQKEVLRPILGEAQNCRVLAATEIARRYAQFCKCSEVELKTSTRDLNTFRTRILKKIPQSRRCSANEWLGFVALTRGGKLTELVIVNDGIENQVSISLMDLVSQILNFRPIAVYLFHNHPNGTLEASQDDFELTQKCQDVLQQVGVSLVEHWIVTSCDQKKIDLIN